MKTKHSANASGTLSNKLLRKTAAKRKSTVLSKIITVMLIVICVVLAVQFTHMNDQITAAKKTQSVLSEQLSTLQSSNAALDAMIKSADDPKIKENIARTRLGLTLPGEIIYKEY